MAPSGYEKTSPLGVPLYTFGFAKTFSFSILNDFSYPLKTGCLKTEVFKQPLFLRVDFMIIPIFIPHEGCRNECTYCNQRSISGSVKPPTIYEAEQLINEYLASADGHGQQIAFFGGSFTGIEIEKQNEYLALAKKYISSGNIESIRLSTRPDYIDEDCVKRLCEFGVKNIELGAQSLDSEVLLKANRGHSVHDVEKASEIILRHNITLGLQMMTGLRGDTNEKCLHTARKIFELGSGETRIYPTIVLKNTTLEKEFQNGEYKAQSIEEAVNISAMLYAYFVKHNIKVLRIGLPYSENLEKNYVAGPLHPSFGELVISRVFRNEIESLMGSCKNVEIFAPKRLISKINGNRKCNILYFKNKNINISVTVDDSLTHMKVNVY